ncbi:glycosyltransferase family 2 protein [Candidatus Dojkabacteria bacterium]|nr:glycosyltransferase family 2 protein [Candidatus Dojkabacteria bacterium]
MDPKLPKLSIIIPAYKAEDFLEESLKRKINAINSIGCDFEIIVVLDGFSPKASEIVKSLSESRIKLIHYKENLGKGFAVAYGMRQATGDLIGYIDAGIDLHESIIPKMYRTQLETAADIVYGNKKHKRSVVNYPIGRRIYSYIYHQFVKLFLDVNVKDSQTGAKLYTKSLVDEVIPRILVKRFAFEVEILSVANRLGFNHFVEVPVFLQADFASTVKFKDGIQALWDTFAVYYRLKLRRFYDRKDVEWNELFFDLNENLIPELVR